MNRRDLFRAAIAGAVSSCLRWLPMPAAPKVVDDEDYLFNAVVRCGLPEVTFRGFNDGRVDADVDAAALNAAQDRLMHEYSLQPFEGLRLVRFDGGNAFALPPRSVLAQVDNPDGTRSIVRVL